jgi:hypothetical protein
LEGLGKGIQAGKHGNIPGTGNVRRDAENSALRRD